MAYCPNTQQTPIETEIICLVRSDPIGVIITFRPTTSDFRQDKLCVLNGNTGHFHCLQNVSLSILLTD